MRPSREKRVVLHGRARGGGVMAWPNHWLGVHVLLPFCLAAMVGAAGCLGGSNVPSSGSASASPFPSAGGTSTGGPSESSPGPSHTNQEGTGQQQTGSPPPIQCHGSGTVPLTNLPMALSDFATLLPYGLVVGGHVTPIDHMYFFPADWPGHRDEYDVHAIADGQIANIQTRPSHQPAGSLPDSVEYRIWIDHTCTFHSYVDLVTSLSPRLLAYYNATQVNQGRDAGVLAITAGELLGKVGGQTLDFGVYNDEKVLPGFLVPAHYARESWKIHTDDPFLYFAEPVRSQLLAKDPRNAEPRAGKIDYDVDGRLIGNWFQVGTNGYAGAHPDNPYNYWSGHLSLTPDASIPSHLIASLGNWSGEAKQFAVKGNAPDFATVSEASGLVKFELVGWAYMDADNPPATFYNFNRTYQHPVAVNNDNVAGVLLVQLTGPRLLKVEGFPGKTAADVTGFDDGANMYER